MNMEEFGDLFDKSHGVTGIPRYDNTQRNNNTGLDLPHVIVEINTLVTGFEKTSSLVKADSREAAIQKMKFFSLQLQKKLRDWEKIIRTAVHTYAFVLRADWRHRGSKKPCLAAFAKAMKEAKPVAINHFNTNTQLANFGAGVQKRYLKIKDSLSVLLRDEPNFEELIRPPLGLEAVGENIYDVLVVVLSAVASLGVATAWAETEVKIFKKLPNRKSEIEKLKINICQSDNRLPWSVDPDFVMYTKLWLNRPLRQATSSTVGPTTMSYWFERSHRLSGRFDDEDDDDEDDDEEEQEEQQEEQQEEEQEEQQEEEQELVANDGDEEEVAPTKRKKKKKNVVKRTRVRCPFPNCPRAILDEAEEQVALLPSRRQMGVDFERKWTTVGRGPKTRRYIATALDKCRYHYATYHPGERMVEALRYSRLPQLNKFLAAQLKKHLEEYEENSGDEDESENETYERNLTKMKQRFKRAAKGNYRIDTLKMTAFSKEQYIDKLEDMVRSGDLDLKTRSERMDT